MKTFNVTGPSRPDQHYMLPAEPRLPDVRRPVERGQCFVLHAPRQSGKTTTLAALAAALTSEGQYAAMRFSCESVETAAEDVRRAEQIMLEVIRDAAQGALPPDCRPPDPWPGSVPGTLLVNWLTEWATGCPRPLVLFFDEIDALRGPSLHSILAQLRDGATARRSSRCFPHSIALCGLRDVRDHKTANLAPGRLETSVPFNIVAEAVRLADFTFTDVTELYAQHTEATGRQFTPQAVRRAFEASQGQPWLVNALAGEVICEKGVPVSEPVTEKHIDEAAGRLVAARPGHLNDLVERLHEPQVKRIIEPLVAGTDSTPWSGSGYDDVSYARDLGLLAQGPPLKIANPIYHEVLRRALA
ncbi:hypothetical protein ACFQ07_27515 [Actinomadura adrarensis]|uniref:AAA+ ATPase domain-containing protein n=1 Tax=Actinomadura adrarensis TaxID=1819600 RepID=A0ABW3CNA9_9ACTN